ncbi:MAG TPA: carbon storage regulator [Planctomycetaceae bacterium]|nr:carbon storage regulator [Planctomycetaceae bacterium]
MLVLSRKEHEEIVINGNIRLKVVEIHGNRVRFGIVAPPEVVIQRQEIVGVPVAGARAARCAERECVCS